MARHFGLPRPMSHDECLRRAQRTIFINAVLALAAIVVLTIAFMLAMQHGANAKTQCAYTNGGHIMCSSRRGVASALIRRGESGHVVRHVSRRAGHLDANGNRAKLIGSRPAGCPYRFCGCGLRKYLGLTDKRLNLAWNWARMFPRTSAHAGAVAVRRHHVMLLVSHVSGRQWLVRSYNGYHHLSWLRVRSVRGYVFVNPGSRWSAR